MGFSIYISILALCTIVSSTIIKTGDFPKQPEFEDNRKFPANFKFGAASSSYQIEGAWNVSGKGMNIMDYMTHTWPETVLDRTNGDIAADSYHLYKRDVEILKELGVDRYRFSLSWSRLMPRGFSHQINPDGVRYYNALIDLLLENKIEPLVTIFHWDLPQSFQDLGGWNNPLMPNFFKDYARFVFETFGDRVKEWVTFNEPDKICLGIYDVPHFEPIYGFSEYLCTHSVLRAHAITYRMYDQEYRPKQRGRITITINSAWFEPYSNSTEDVAAAETDIQFELGWFGHAIYSKEGDYHPIMKEKLDRRSKLQGLNSSRLIKFTDEDREMIKGTFDYFSLNHYTAYLSKAASKQDLSITYYTDSETEKSQDPSWPSGFSPWLKVVPWGLTKILKKINQDYGNIEIVITENGYSDDKNEGLVDMPRIDYHRRYLSAVLDAIDEGCNVTGYFVWSLMDNFEWNRGYTEKFGLYHIDFEDPKRKRTPKASAKFYSEVIKSRKVPSQESLCRDLKLCQKLVYRARNSAVSDKSQYIMFFIASLPMYFISMKIFS